MTRYILLLNRAAGGNERGLVASEVCRTVEETFRKSGLHLTSRIVEPDQIEAEIKDSIAAQPDAIIVGGGDGTVSTAARLLGGTGIALGILPMGTFNLAARDLGVPLEIQAASDFLAAAKSFRVDVLTVAGHTCLCTVILGFYPEFSNIFEKRDHGGSWLKKFIRLVTAFPKIFTRARAIALAWDADGVIGRARTKFSAFVPGSFRSSVGIVPARTDFQSGTMTAYIGTHKTSAGALRAMLDGVLGRQEKNADLTVFKARSIQIRAAKRKHLTVMLDGEILRLKLPVHLDILPAHLNVLTTAEIAEGTSETPEAPDNPTPTGI